MGRTGSFHSQSSDTVINHLEETSTISNVLKNAQFIRLKARRKGTALRLTPQVINTRLTPRMRCTKEKQQQQQQEEEEEEEEEKEETLKYILSPSKIKI